MGIFHEKWVLAHWLLILQNRGLTVPIGGGRKPSPHFLLINHCVFLTEGFLQRKESSRQKTSYCTFSNISLSTKSKLNSNLGIPKISISFSVIFLAA